MSDIPEGHVDWHPQTQEVTILAVPENKEITVRLLISVQVNYDQSPIRPTPEDRGDQPS